MLKETICHIILYDCKFSLVILANVIALVGWGSYFPWSVPALYAGFTGPEGTQLELLSYLLVITTGLAGMIGTSLWWQLADQSR